MTSTCGSAVCAKVAELYYASAHENALHDANIIFNRRCIFNSDLIGITRVPNAGTRADLSYRGPWSFI